MPGNALRGAVPFPVDRTQQPLQPLGQRAQHPGKDGAARQDFVWRVCGQHGKPVFGQLFQQHRGLVRKVLENPYLAEIFWRNPG